MSLHHPSTFREIHNVVGPWAVLSFVLQFVVTIEDFFLSGCRFYELIACLSLQIFFILRELCRRLRIASSADFPVFGLQGLLLHNKVQEIVLVTFPYKNIDITNLYFILQSDPVMPGKQTIKCNRRHSIALLFVQIYSVEPSLAWVFLVYIGHYG